MKTMVVRSILGMRRLGVRVMILLTSTLVPLQACAQTQPFKVCAGQEIAIDASGIKLCIRENRSWVWVKPAPGNNFQIMAEACCAEAAQVRSAWEKHYGNPPHPDRETWYPVPLTLLKATVRSQIESLPGAASLSQPGGAGGTTNLGDAGTEDQDAKDGSNAKSGTEDPGKAGGEARESNAGPGEWLKSRMPLLVGAMAFCLSLAALGSTVFWSRKLSVRLAQVEHETTAIKESLVGLRAGIPQKITVELTPPLAAKFPDWEPFLYKVRDTLGHRAVAARTEARSGVSSSAFGLSAAAPKVPGGVERQRLDLFPAQVSVRAARQETSGERRYVERATTYGAAAQNFGGEIVFQEANGDWGSFYIEPAGQRNGWLYPNPSAREFDPLHQKLFNLGINDFPLKVNVDPRPVLWDGQRWVLDSQGA